MKIVKNILLAFIAIGLITACSKDEEAKPEQELKEASFGFDAEDPPIEVPTALETSDNEQAQQIATYLNSINSITTYTSYFNAPDDAEVSNTPINTGTSGGRMSATQENVVVYTWTYTQGDESVTYAYQVSEDNQFYYFEYFIKYNDDPYLSLIKGAESKADLKEGYLEWFSDYGSDEYLLRYEWTENADGSFVFNYYASSYTIELNIAADGSGTIDYYESGNLFANYTWNAAGTEGSYTTYDSEGNATTVNWTSEG